MFKIIKEGALIGMTEAPKYIKKAANGCFNLCPELEAQGISFAGNPYHLLGRDELDGLETVSLEEADAGVELQAVSETVTSSAKLSGSLHAPSVTNTMSAFSKPSRVMRRRASRSGVS